MVAEVKRRKIQDGRYKLKVVGVIDSSSGECVSPDFPYAKFKTRLSRLDWEFYREELSVPRHEISVASSTADASSASRVFAGSSRLRDYDDTETVQKLFRRAHCLRLLQFALSVETHREVQPLDVFSSAIAGFKSGFSFTCIFIFIVQCIFHAVATFISAAKWNRPSKPPWLRSASRRPRSDSPVIRVR
jgi:hypothetical protein